MAQPGTLATKEVAEVATPEATRCGLYFTPRVDIYENANEVVLLCDMPGAKPADVDVKFEKGELSLHATIHSRCPQGPMLREEYAVGDFCRTFAISPEIDPEKISAEYREGVLTVHLPKQEKAKPKQITVKAG